MKKALFLIVTVLTVFSTNGLFAKEDAHINVYRWLNANTGEYVTVVENEYTDALMQSWGWKNKTMIFSAYRDPAPGRVAVYGWVNTKDKDHISVAENEFTDAQMMQSGYSHKHLQFYTLSNHKVATK